MIIKLRYMFRCKHNLCHASYLIGASCLPHVLVSFAGISSLAFHVLDKLIDTVHLISTDFFFFFITNIKLTFLLNSATLAKDKAPLRLSR